MNDREHGVLDGDLGAEALSGEERLRLASLSAAAAETVEALRAYPAPDLTARVMGEIARAGSGTPACGQRIGAVVGWLWEPRPVSLVLRPAYAAAAALAILLATALWQGTPAGPGTPGNAFEAAAPAVVYVQFRFEAPGATTVEVAGSFTNWRAGVHLAETTPGVWSTLVALEPGVHDYTFIIDGVAWVIDPTAPAVEDGFGGMNSRLFLTRPLENA